MKHLLQPISNLFHPLLSISWAALLLLFYTPLCVVPIGLRTVVFLEVVFMTFLLPSVIIIFMSKLGIIKNGVALRDRADRVVPLCVQMVLYIILSVLLKVHGMPIWALYVFYGASALAVVFVIVTNWWKISAHAGCNAALATVALTTYYEFPDIMPLMLPLFLIVMTGAVSSIRVYLGRHTLSQVSVGALAGVILMSLSYFICLYI